MRSAILAGLVVIGGFANSAWAQVDYNPYKPYVDDAPAVSADGKLHWPAFFKSAGFEMYYQWLWATGSCQGTNMRITIPAMQNRLEIDQLPERSVAGRVTSVGPGMVEILEDGGKVTTVVTHPAGVTRVKVTGDMPAAALVPGVTVRLLGRIDETGQGQEVLDVLDVITLPADFKYPRLRPGALQAITAQVHSLERQLLQLKIGKSPLKIRYRLADAAVAHVNASEIGLAGVGDRITAKGYNYESTGGKKPVHVIFASDVTVEKPTAAPAQTASATTGG